MECSDVADRLTDLLEGDIDSETEAAALEHLATCEQCEQVLAETRDVMSLAQEYGRAALSDEDRARMFGALTERLERDS